MVREIIEAHTLPEYRMTLDAADKVTFYVRNPHLTRLLTRSSGQSWRRPVAGGRHWTHRAVLSNDGLLAPKSCHLRGEQGAKLLKSSHFSLARRLAGDAGDRVGAYRAWVSGAMSSAKSSSICACC